MLKRYKNGFIELIEKHGFSPSQFKRYEKEVDSNPAFILQIENTPMFFMARTSSDDYHALDIRYIKFAPDYPKTDYHPDNSWTNISDVYETFEYWLVKHAKMYLEEIDSPDMWEQIDGMHLFSVDPLVARDDSNFDKVEKEKLRAMLSHFREMLEIEFKPTADQLETINDRLEYLSDSLDRVNKVDWQGLAISTIVSISIALSLDTERGKNLFQLFKNAFSSATKFIAG